MARQRPRCTKTARMAIATGTVRNADGLVSRVYYEIEDAPRTATPLCKEHGEHQAADLVKTLVQED